MHELLAGAEAETKQKQKQKKVDRRKQLPPGSGDKQKRRRRPSATMQRAHTDSDAMAEGRWRTDSLSEADVDPQGGGGGCGGMDVEGGVFYHFGEEEEEAGEDEKEDDDDNDTSRSHSFYSESDGDDDDNSDSMFEKMQVRCSSLLRRLCAVCVCVCVCVCVVRACVLTKLGSAVPQHEEEFGAHRRGHAAPRRHPTTTECRLLLPQKGSSRTHGTHGMRDMVVYLGVWYSPAIVRGVQLQSHSDKTTPVKRAVNILRTSRGSSFILPRSDDEFLQVRPSILHIPPTTHVHHRLSDSLTI
jgi:hypothetical protein